LDGSQILNSDMFFTHDIYPSLRTVEADVLRESLTCQQQI